jgi:protein-S-isoprenylcysteine O-methyltransferase Ste14
MNYYLIVSLAVASRLTWLCFEMVHRRRYPQSNARLDKHSGTFWDAANLLELVGLVLAVTGVGRFGPSLLCQFLGIALLINGIIIRISAMQTLGHYFTSLVTVRSDHRIISSGLYKHMRHPAYTGALVAHLGLGLVFSSWISMSLSVLPFFIAAWYRIKVEEKVLLESFGVDYGNYAARTARLIPKVF